jgi:hypothetical protein
MACDPKSLVANAMANGDFSAPDRQTLLLLAGFYSNGLTAQAAVSAGVKFQFYDDRMIWQALLKVICLGG